MDKGNSVLVKDELAKAGGQISDQQARSVIYGFEDQVWSFHIYFGYALAVLLLFRVISEFFEPKDQRVFKKLSTAYHNYFVKPKVQRLARHELMTKVLYLFFYLLLILMVITGLCIAFDQEFGISKAFSHQLKEIHGFVMYLIMAFILLHVFGVFLAEQKDGKGIVSDMINGGVEQK